MNELTKTEGLRFNENKLRYDLLEPSAMEHLVNVFTKGALKYEDNNWLKGMKWSKCVASMKRHIAAFERGEDFDFDPNCETCKTGTCTNHTGIYHMAHAAWNALAIVSYYKLAPQFDDRKHWWKKPLKKVWLDLDGVLADYEKHFLSYFNLPAHHPTDWDDARFRNNFHRTFDNEEFWLTCPALIKPEQLTYPITGYCTTRPVSNEVIRQWLNNNGFPAAELINIYHDKTLTKASVLKDAGCDVMVDDSIKNFMDLNQAGILCYLMTRPHNVKFDVGNMRVNNIEEFIQRVKA